MLIAKFFNSITVTFFMTSFFVNSLFAQVVQEDVSSNLQDKVNSSKGFSIFFDCYTSDHHFSCFKIKESLELNLKYNDKIVSSPEGSDAVLKLRTREVQDGTIDKIIVEESFIIQGEERWMIKKPFIELEINDTTIMEIVNQIVNFLGTQRGITSISVNDKGAMVTEYSTDASNTSIQSSNLKNWYFSPQGSIFFKNVVDQNKNLSFDLGATFVKSQKKSKVILSSKGFINKSEIKLDDEKSDSYTEVMLRIKGLYIRTLSNDKWSVAIIGKVVHAPQDNLILDSEILLGVEYQLVPFVTKAEDKTFSLRYVIGPEFYKLEDKNFLDQKDFMLLKHGLELAGRFNFSKFNNNNQPLSLDLNLGVESEINSFRYANLFFETGVNFNLTERISLSPQYSISFAKSYPNQPKEVSDGGVLDTVKNAGRFGLLRHSFHLNLSVAIGSSGLRNTDRRWQ